MLAARTIEAHTTTTEATFAGVGGLQIFTRSWRPAGHPRGIVVIAPGFNSHSGQYADAAERLTTAQLVVYALDHRGRGHSGGERFHVDRFADYVSDLATFIADIKRQEPGLSVFLLGHSAGGIIAGLYAQDHQAELAGLISESFAFHLPAPGFALSILKAIAYVFPHLRVLKLNNADFSRDPAAVDAMNRDPLIKGESQTARTAAELIRADERLTRGIPQLKLPTLILHGTKDKAAKSSGSEYFYQHAGSSDKTLKLYDGAFHDLLNDSDKEMVLSDIISWIDNQLVRTG
jgi:alpha-beta hydrolase superfamily lysophospholipase